MEMYSLLDYLIGFACGVLTSWVDPAFTVLTYIVLINIDKKTITPGISISFLVGAMIGILIKKVNEAEIGDNDGDNGF